MSPEEASALTPLKDIWFPFEELRTRITTIENNNPHLPNPFLNPAIQFGNQERPTVMQELDRRARVNNSRTGQDNFLRATCFCGRECDNREITWKASAYGTKGCSSCDPNFANRKRHFLRSSDTINRGTLPRKTTGSLNGVRLASNVFSTQHDLTEVDFSCDIIVHQTNCTSTSRYVCEDSPGGLPDPDLSGPDGFNYLKLEGPQGLAKSLFEKMAWADDYSFNRRGKKALRQPGDAIITRKRSEESIGEQKSKEGIFEVCRVGNLYAQLSPSGRNRPTKFLPNGEPREKWFKESFTNLCNQVLQLQWDTPTAWFRRPQVLIPKGIGCGLAKGNSTTYRIMIMEIAKNFPTIDFTLVTSPDEPWHEKPRLPASGEESSDPLARPEGEDDNNKANKQIPGKHTFQWNEKSKENFDRVRKRSLDWFAREYSTRDLIYRTHPRVKELASQLFLFADASRCPVVMPPKTRGKVTTVIPAGDKGQDRNRIKDFFEDCVKSFADDFVGDDNRFDQLFECYEQLSNEEIIDKVDNNLRIIKEINSIIEEVEQEGVSIRPTIIRILADRIQWPDPTDFLENCILAGPMPPCSVYPIENRRKMLKKNKITRQHLMKPSRVRKTNDKMIDRVRKQLRGKGIPFISEMRMEALELCEKGKQTMMTLAEFLSSKHRDSTLLTPNFAVNQMDKIRQCTDFSEAGSNVNGAAEITNKTILHDHRFLDNLLTRASKQWKTMKLWKSDLKGAYRQLPLKPEERRLGTMLLGEDVVTPIVLGFGSRAAVFHFTQFSLLMTTLVIAITATPTLVYIDDEFGVVPDEEVVIEGETRDMAGELYKRVRLLHELCGVDLHPCFKKDKDGVMKPTGKSVEPTKSLVILGLTVTLTEDGLTVSADKEKRERLILTLDRAISGDLDRDRAGRLAGALGFLAYGFKCRITRGYLGGLYNYQYGAVELGEIKVNLLWWRNILNKAFERKGVVDYKHKKTAFDFTLMCPDASVSHAGATVFRGRWDSISGMVKSRGHFTSIEIPRIVTERHTRNSPLRETCAILFGLLLNAGYFADHEVLILGDCHAANCAVHRGYSKAKYDDCFGPRNRIIATNLALITSMVTSQTPCGMWLQHCPGIWQWGDYPSRPHKNSCFRDNDDSGIPWHVEFKRLGIPFVRTAEYSIASELMEELVSIEEPIDPDALIVKRFEAMARGGKLEHDILMNHLARSE
jgi:hypothetical protein